MGAEAHGKGQLLVLAVEVYVRVAACLDAYGYGVLVHAELGFQDGRVLRGVVVFLEDLHLVVAAEQDPGLLVGQGKAVVGINLCRVEALLAVFHDLVVAVEEIDFESFDAHGGIVAAHLFHVAVEGPIPGPNLS